MQEKAIFFSNDRNSHSHSRPTAKSRLLFYLETVSFTRFIRLTTSPRRKFFDIVPTCYPALLAGGGGERREGGGGEKRERGGGEYEVMAVKLTYFIDLKRIKIMPTLLFISFGSRMHSVIPPIRNGGNIIFAFFNQCSFINDQAGQLVLSQ